MKFIKGIAAVEYLIIVSALLLALLTPVDSNKNSLQLLADALKSLYAGWVYMMSTAVFS
jgi:hypothetical protein